jgi:hypothetical protein
MMNSTTMYKLLVHDPDDALAALAFTTYKQHEMEVMDGILAATGEPPSQSDIDAFYIASSTPTMLAMYEQRAEILLNTFLEEALKSRKQALEMEFNATRIGQQLQSIQKKQSGKKSWKGWAADVSGNLAVNFVTILVIAGLLFGFRGLDQILNTFGQQTGLLGKEPSERRPTKKTPSISAPATAPDHPPGN